MKKLMATVVFPSLFILHFGYVGLGQLLSLKQFTKSVAHMPYTGIGAGLLAVAIPLASLCVVLLLIFLSLRKAGLYVAALLFFLFSLYLLVVLLAGKPLPCSCGGPFGGLAWGWYLVFYPVLSYAAYWCTRFWEAKVAST